jgi:hypothetical protein
VLHKDLIGRSGTALQCRMGRLGLPAAHSLMVALVKTPSSSNRCVVQSGDRTRKVTGTGHVIACASS